MLNRTRTSRRLATALAVAAAVAAVPLALAAPTAPPAPETLEVPAGNKLFLVAHAVGVQIYACDGTRWSFVAPRATLYGDNGHVIGEHFAGPTWQGRDGSFVKAAADRRLEVDGTIPWLRLAKTSAGAGADGDRFAGTTYIQRLATAGGVAPAAATCDADAAGTVAEVPYTANYTFWKD